MESWRLKDFLFANDYRLLVYLTTHVLDLITSLVPAVLFLVHRFCGLRLFQHTSHKQVMTPHTHVFKRRRHVCFCFAGGFFWGEGGLWGWGRGRVIRKEHERRPGNIATAVYIFYWSTLSLE